MEKSLCFAKCKLVFRMSYFDGKSTLYPVFKLINKKKERERER